MSEEITKDDLETTADFLENYSVQLVFFGRLRERRSEILESLIESGKEEDRFRVQMIDEVLETASDIREELKSE